MAGIVAYVSVSGLLKVFTGAGTMGLMLFTTIEIAKIVATSAIHTYSKKIGWFYNGLLSLMIVISMTITSMGIYGFLSSSYMESFAKMENVDSQVELLEKKRDGFQDQLTFVIGEKETLNSTISELTKGLSNNVIQYKDKETGEIITTTSTSTRRVLEKQLDNAVLRQDIVNVKADSLTVIVFDLENDILETKLGNDAASELSTLKYLADVTGRSMDEVMKWFILLLIIIGDPMAVLMVIVFNKVVKKEDDIEGLPMDDLIDDKPKEPTKPNIGNNGEPAESIDTLPEEPKSDYVKQIQDKMRRDVPIEDDTLNEVVNDVVNEHVELEEEPSLPNPADDMIIKKKTDKVRMDEPVEEEPIKLGEDLGFDPQPVEEVSQNQKDFDDMVNGGLKEETIENTPEEQIEENVEDVKQLKREPVIPRGKIIESDVIKSTDRGFSVKVPDPKITKVGSQKEIREDKPNTFFFKRKRGDELGND